MKSYKPDQCKLLTLTVQARACERTKPADSDRYLAAAMMQTMRETNRATHTNRETHRRTERTTNKSHMSQSRRSSRGSQKTMREGGSSGHREHQASLSEPGQATLFRAAVRSPSAGYQCCVLRLGHSTSAGSGPRARRAPYSYCITQRQRTEFQPMAWAAHRLGHSRALSLLPMPASTSRASIMLHFLPWHMALTYLLKPGSGGNDQTSAHPRTRFSLRLVAEQVSAGRWQTCTPQTLAPLPSPARPPPMLVIRWLRAVTSTATFTFSSWARQSYMDLVAHHISD